MGKKVCLSLEEVQKFAAEAILTLVCGSSGSDWGQVLALSLSVSSAAGLLFNIMFELTPVYSKPLLNPKPHHL